MKRFLLFSIITIVVVGCVARSLDVGVANENEKEQPVDSDATPPFNNTVPVYPAPPPSTPPPPPSAPWDPPDAAPTAEELAQPIDGPNYLKGFGIAANSSYALAHRGAHFPDQDLRGTIIWTVKGDACDASNVEEGARGVMIIFAKAAGDIPPIGTYTFVEDQLHPETHVLGLGVGMNLACAHMGQTGEMVSGKLELTRSDAQGLEGSFEGVWLYPYPTSGTSFARTTKPVSGRFKSERCVGSIGPCKY